MLHDVIIAGAGPVGLFLACELRLANLDVLVLEKAAAPHSPLKRLPFGLRGLWGTSIDAFYRRGMLEALATQPSADPRGPGHPSGGQSGKGPAGHFAGIQFDHANIDTARWSYRLPGPADMQIGAEMEHVERVLATQARALGVTIRRGRGVDHLESTDDDVTVRSDEETFRARWLVGCDGGRSTVRKQAGFDFVGTEPELTGYGVQLDLADPSQLPLGRHHTATGMFTQWQPGWIVMADFDGGAGHRAELSREHVEQILRRVSGREVTVKEVHVGSTWSDRSKQTTTYRKGRVLLAGDAAHIHSPLGGQGLNLGLGDAMNLGWKLAATVRGDAPEGLLDTYTKERHPIGARILEWTRAQVALMRPSSRALQAVFRDLVATRDGATYLAERVWGVSLRYGLDDAHPLVGRSSPDFELEDGTRLAALLREGTGVLLDFDDTLGALATTWGDRVKHVPRNAKDRLGLSAVLVRPDGFVAWASDTPAAPDEITRAAARWFMPR